MQSSNFLSIFFAVLAIAFLLVSLILYFCFPVTPLHFYFSQESIKYQTESFMDAICHGDYFTAGNMIYGKPEINTSQEFDSELSDLMWNAFSGSINYEFHGECYYTQTGIFRDVFVTVPNMAETIPLIEDRFQVLLVRLSSKSNNAEEIYDEDGNYLKTFLNEAFCEAATQIMQEGNPVSTYEITLEINYQSGQWWIMPNQKLIDVLSGMDAD